MAKLLHTADVHLREQDDERWQALQTLLQTAQKLKVDGLTIAGDLFDQNVNAQNLRDKLRALFSQYDFKIIILPGNHDLYSFEPGLYFGDNVTLLTSADQEIKLDNTVITGIPFEPLSAGELFKKIQLINDKLDPKNTNILLFHGELTDIFFNSADFGDEGKKRYLPLKLNLLAETAFDYVLAGHFHTKFHLKRLPNQRMKQGGFFVYPGSPVSVTTKETGIRQAALIETSKTPQEIELKTHHFQSIKLQLYPNDTDSKLKKFEQQIKTLDDTVIGLCQVTGFFDQAKLQLTEEELKTKIDQLLSRYHCQMKSDDFKVKDINSILNSGLYQTFAEKLNQTDYSEPERQALLQKFIQALIQANS